MNIRRSVSALAVTLAVLAPVAVFAADVGPAADTQALHQLIRDFEAARRSNDMEAMSKLYTQDSSYFPKSGREAFGNRNVIELLFARSLGDGAAKPAAPAPSQPARPAARIVVDSVEAGGTMGMVYGRVCAAGSDGKEACGQRWLLVTRKENDGKWRIRADIDNARLDPQPAGR